MLIKFLLTIDEHIYAMKQLTEAKLLYRIPEVAYMMGLSRAQVYRLLDLRQLDSIYIGRSRRITKGQLQRFVQAKEDLCPPVPMSLAPLP